jgi:hypothetical protein
MDILTKKFGVTEQDGIFNFSKAKTLYLFCNGLWCGQSPAAIRSHFTIMNNQTRYYFLPTIIIHYYITTLQ